jgi:AcrR family transcriptional regulator
MLFQALGELLGEKNFADISVQDIAERSTVNRATFYDHFADKFALLDEKIAEEFRSKFEARMAGTEASCPMAQKQLVLTLCDFLVNISCCQKLQRQFEPLMESRVKSVIREYMLRNLANRGITGPDAELRATLASWAMYGAVLEWSRTKPTPPEELADMILPLIRPSLHCE